MIVALLIAASVVLVSGLAFKYLIPLIFRDYDWHISWREFITGALVALTVVLPATFAIGKAWSTYDALRYEEFYNGVETSATFTVEDCYPGSSGGSASSGRTNCDHEYNTGQSYTYTVMVSYTTTSCNGKGQCTTTTHTRPEVRVAYIYEPYAHKEYRYTITDSLGGSYTFPGAFVKDGEGYNGQAIPSDIPRGDPAEWTDAWQHLEVGNPRPVTRLFSYNNYILASKDELLNAYSEEVDRYLEEGILPDHTANIRTNPLYGYSNSTADKVSFVGVTVEDEAAWQYSLMNLNGALGSELQGDMHVVLIDESLVDSPLTYLNALKAYWQSEDYGRRTLAKNGIIVVAGVRGSEVVWAKASTGMPFGNEVMLQGIESFLHDVPLTPADVIGDPHTVVTPASSDEEDDAVTVKHGDAPGVLERVVLMDFPFERACMECAEGEGIGYDDLIIEVEPKPWQWAIMIIVIAIPTLVWWFLAGRFEFLNWERWFNRRRILEEEQRAQERERERFYSYPYENLSKKKRRKLRR